MKRPKSEPPSGGGGGGRRLRLSHFLMGVAALYLLFISFKFPHFLQMASSLSGDDTLIQLHRSSSLSSIVEDEGSDNDLSSKPTIFHRKLEDNDNENGEDENIIARPHDLDEQHDAQFQTQPIKPLQHKYGRITGEMMRRMNKRSGLSSFERMADEAWTLGSKAWQELDEDFDVERANQATKIMEGKEEDACPTSVHVNGEQFAKGDNLMFLPCGLKAGSSITIMGTPHSAHEEYVPQHFRMRDGDATVWVSQFKVELLGLKVVDGEDPPRILHLNPRLKGDWSHRSVIEHNTCYRMQWGVAQRCDGTPSRHTDDMLVDGFRRCEKWAQRNFIDSKEPKTTSWFQRFIGREQKPDVTWPFAFVEDRLFVLTLRAGVEGYHISVGGRHVTSFPYRTGFTLEDATGLTITGDLDVHSVYATSLPISHLSFSLQRVLEMSEKWKARPLPKRPVQLFIGILSATNHFAERMAVRKTWMQSPAVKSLNVVARFFVALSPRKEVNAVLKKEAAYFGDTVILPFMDRYELVVLKTIAICEYGVHNVTASHIMKCDDDTFVRVDTVLKEISGISRKRSLYMGNLNLLHRPLRTGKWAVTFEEWPEAVYPPYANGPGYIISSDIARFIISQHANHTLRLFKMEDVSMGMWVEQFNSTFTVQYSHNWKFCQYGCMENYFTAHYQSPRQMLCLWDNLARGHAHCCNYR